MFDSIIPVSSLQGDTVYLAEDISAVCKYPVSLKRNSEFTGRTTTQVFADGQSVVKLRTDFVFQDKDVERRTLGCRDKERALGVYHPHKTWFYAEGGDGLVIGNVTPRLSVLNAALPKLYQKSNKHLNEVFKQWFDLYFRAAKTSDVRLDEGLSNFGLDGGDTLYYLDDDTYGWDDFSSLSVMFSVWCRQYEFIDPPFCTALAHKLVQSLLEVFNSKHLLNVVYGQFRSQPTYSDREQQLIDSVMAVIKTAIKGSPVHSPSQNSQTTTPKTGNQDEVFINRDNKIAILADVHSNQPALTAILDDIKTKGVSQIVILGDLVGYGPHPEACVETIRNLQALVIQGNHDYAAASSDIHRGFSRMARWAIEWTRPQLSSESIKYLSDLAPVIFLDDWMFVHGAPVDKHYFFAYVYQMTYSTNLDWMAEHNIAKAFHGHSHIQSVYSRGLGEDQLHQDKKLALTDFHQTLICPGSVGQPRGGDWRAEYALLDAKTDQLEFIKLEYDLDKVLADLRRFGFPSPLIDRYIEGK